MYGFMNSNVKQAQGRNRFSAGFHSVIKMLYIKLLKYQMPETFRKIVVQNNDAV